MLTHKTISDWLVFLTSITTYSSNWPFKNYVFLWMKTHFLLVPYVNLVPTSLSRLHVYFECAEYCVEGESRMCSPLWLLHLSFLLNTLSVLCWLCLGSWMWPYFCFPVIFNGSWLSWFSFPLWSPISSLNQVSTLVLCRMG